MDGNTYLGGKFDAFCNVFCVLGVFLGGNLGFWGVKSPQEIARINTARKNSFRLNVAMFA